VNPAQALRVRKRVVERLTRAVRSALTPFSGRPLRPVVRRGIHSKTRPLVAGARSELLASANIQYRQFVRDDPLPPPVLTHFSPEVWEQSLTKVLVTDTGEVDPEEFSDEMIEEIERKADWWARDAERGALIDYTQRDDRIGRWARIDPEPPSCPFCVVLISRGAVYLSKEAAGFSEIAKFHTGCTCTPVLVSPEEREEFQGSDLRLDALHEYRRAVEEARSGDINEIVAAMRSLRSEGKTP
jgi:hypothetical protein